MVVGPGVGAGGPEPTRASVEFSRIEYADTIGGKSM